MAASAAATATGADCVSRTASAAVATSYRVLRQVSLVRIIAMRAAATAAAKSDGVRCTVAAIGRATDTASAASRDAVFSFAALTPGHAGAATAAASVVGVTIPARIAKAQRRIAATGRHIA